MSKANKAPAAAATTAQTTQSDAALLDSIIPEVWRPRDQQEHQQFRSLLEEFIKQITEGHVVSKYTDENIKYWIAQIDKKLSEQLNEIMHHPAFQQLEGTWRGLHYLLDKSETDEQLKIKVLNVSKQELYKDLERAVEPDQSNLYKKVYQEEFGQLGGQPYGMLVGDYDFSRHPEDVDMLKRISKVAAAAHAPFVSAASPELFGFRSFTQLPNPRDLAKIFSKDDPRYASWNSFRESEDSRYVALTLPKVLARLPYGKDFKRVDAFNFEEYVDGQDHSKYLWMNAAWAYATRITDAFSRYGWMMRSRGVEAGGKVEGLPVHTFQTDEGDWAMKCPTEISIPDDRENELSGLGFLPLLHSKNNDFAAFIGAQSCQKAKEYDRDFATANADLSTKFNYLLCVSRFAHYLKVMARDKIGELMEPKDCEAWLNRWILNYVIANPEDAGPELKAKCPLADARVEVRENKKKPGWYEAVAFLRPHFQLEGLKASMRLVTEVPKKA